MAKKKLTITLDGPVLTALTELQRKYESEAYNALDHKGHSLLSMIRYSRSATVQMALMAAFKQNDIEVHWPEIQDEP